MVHMEVFPSNATVVVKLEFSENSILGTYMGEIEGLEGLGEVEVLEEGNGAALLLV